MKIDTTLLDVLTAQAKANPRLRQAYDLRTNSEDQSQRMLNALEPGTIMPIHRHRNTSETMVMVRGALIERFYNEDGSLAHEFEMRAGGECLVVQIEAGQWHSLEVLETGTIIFEAKDGRYEPLGENDVLTVNG
jgi:cupin fold WbuC family metalloprotein